MESSLVESDFIEPTFSDIDEAIVEYFRGDKVRKICDPSRLDQSIELMRRSRGEDLLGFEFTDDDLIADFINEYNPYDVFNFYFGEQRLRDLVKEN